LALWAVDSKPLGAGAVEDFEANNFTPTSMKFPILCFAVLLVSYAVAMQQPHRVWAYDTHKGPELEEPVLNERLIAEINNDPSSPWKAGMRAATFSNA